MPDIIEIDAATCRLWLSYSLNEVFPYRVDEACRGNFYRQLSALAERVSGKKTNEQVKEQLLEFFVRTKNSKDYLSVSALMKNRVGVLLKHFYKRLCEKCDIKDSLDLSCRGFELG